MTTLGTYPIFKNSYLVNDLEQACTRWNRVNGAGPNDLSLGEGPDLHHA